MWTRARRLTPAACAIRAAPRVPHWPGDSPSASMISWSSQHMQSIRSASFASSVTESQGWVSPVNTTLPAGVSKRYANESKKGCTCSAGAGSNLPVAAGEYETGADVGCLHMGRSARERSAAVLVDALAERMPDARLPVVREYALALV